MPIMLSSYKISSSTIFSVFLSLSIVFPTKLQNERLILLFLLIILTIKKLIGNKFKFYLKKELIILLFSTSLVSIFGLLNSWSENSPGVNDFITLYLIWPLLFVFLSSTNPDLQIQDFFKRVFPWVYLFLLVSIIIFIPSFLFNFENPFTWYYEIIDARINFISAYPEFSAPIMGWFTFGVPYFASMFFLKWQQKKLRAFDILLVCMSSLVLLLSGRRGMWLSVALSIFISTGLLIFYNRAITKKILISTTIILMIGTIFLQQLGFEVIVVLESLNIDLKSSSDSTRINQIISLYEGWKNSPLFGEGIGSITEDRRNGFWLQPWAYEMQYNLLLFQVGLIGLLVYSISTSYVTLKALKIALYRQDIILFSMITGFISLLLANATNPYMNKFDYLWVLFLFIHVLNQKE